MGVSVVVREEGKDLELFAIGSAVLFLCRVFLLVISETLFSSCSVY